MLAGGKPGVKYPRSKYPNGIPGVTTAEFPKAWFEGVAQELYKSRRYSTKNNCYKVKSGHDQAGWESSGWIMPCDPRGWTQWYFRYFAGRRLDDGEDERQIARWSGVCGIKGRWKSNLIAKCLSAGAAHDDARISPVPAPTAIVKPSHPLYPSGEAHSSIGLQTLTLLPHIRAPNRTSPSCPVISCFLHSTLLHTTHRLLLSAHRPPGAQDPCNRIPAHMQMVSQTLLH